MDEIGKEELLEEFNRMFARWGGLVGKEKQAYNQIRKLISDYDTNLADCTEAIDALIEERDALIEDNKACDERIDEIVEDYRRLDSELSGVDEELMEQMKHCISYPYDIGRMRWRGLMIKAVKLLSQKRAVTMTESQVLELFQLVKAFEPFKKKIKELGIEVK